MKTTRINTNINTSNTYIFILLQKNLIRLLFELSILIHPNSMEQMIRIKSLYPEYYYLLLSPFSLKQSLLDSPLTFMVKIYTSIDNLFLWLVITFF